jgi:hypothetical protein
MFGNAFLPLRTTVGGPLLIRGAQVTDRAPELAAHRIEVARVEDFVNSPLHRVMLPDQLHLTDSAATYGRGHGVATFPPPADLPLPPGMFDDGTLFAVIAIGPPVDEEISRRLWFEVEFAVAKPQRQPGIPVVGGLCYSGDPYLPYYITAQGENSANFGLPREIRLAWGHNDDHAAFLDDESAITQQEPASHSGVHIIATGPIALNRVKVRFADFPRIIRRVGTSGAPGIEERWGVYLPFLFFFEYQEDVRFHPRVPGGLLAAVQVPANRTHTYFAAAREDGTSVEDAAGFAADFIYTTEDPKEYFPLSAASIFRQHRRYGVHVLASTPGDNRIETVEETFISQAVTRGDQVRLFIAQTEEHNRCLSGIRLAFPDRKIVPYFTNGAMANLDVKVYELDPIEGVSPVDLTRDPATDKYATLVYHARGVAAGTPALNCRFIRPTTSRYLAVVFTSESERGFVALDDLELVQSAHVTVSPRKSRTQRIRALNFRLIGANLAEDYARLGDKGFSFAIERVVAGERKDILFEARSLLDLLQLSGARLYANQRYLETTRDVSHETSITLAGSHDWRRTEAASDGWRRSQSGAGTTWQAAAGGYARKLDDGPGDSATFETFSNAETRTRTQHLGGEALTAATALTEFRALIQALPAHPAAVGDVRHALLKAIDALGLDSNSLRSGSGWEPGGRFWSGIAAGQVAPVQGLLNVAIPPVLIPADFFQDLLTFFRDPLGLTPENALELLVGNPLFPFFAIVNGLGFGANIGGSASLGIPPFSFSGNSGVSVSTSQLLPTLTRTNTTGSNGTISAHASRTGSSYSQSLNTGYDDSRLYSEYTDDSTTTRDIARDLFQEGTVRERTAGVGVFWRQQAMDIVCGSVPLSVTLPATADKVYRTTDDTIRVRFGNGMNDGLRALLLAAPDGSPRTDPLGNVTMDVWFDLEEEVIRDDY